MCLLYDDAVFKQSVIAPFREAFPEVPGRRALWGYG